jgi:hypothetical protein
MLRKFSVTFLPEKVKIYKLDHSISSCKIMCQTVVCDPNDKSDIEITVYKYIAEDDYIFEKKSIVYDPRQYNIINIHEDVPGIDHVGIVHYISGIFYKEHIPLLYLNTYSYNLILISDEYIERAKNLLI